MAMKWMMAAVLVTLAGWSRPVPGGAQATGGIAFVNMETVFGEYYKTKRADERLKEKAEEFGEERNAMVEEMRGLEEQFEAARQEAQDATLSDRAREQKREEAEERLAELKVKEREIRAYEEERRSQLEAQGKRMRQRIVDEITGEIGALAKERNLFVVVDTSGESKNNIPLLVYFDAQADITDDIVNRLNQNQTEFDPDDEAKP